MSTQEYHSTDRDTVVLLLSEEVPVIRYFLDDRNKTTFVFDLAKAEKIVNDHIQGKYECYDKFVKAQRLFNSIIHSR